MLLGDVTGDRYSDLLIEAEFTELLVYAGVPDADLFASEPWKVPVLLHDGEFVWLDDMNQDGVQDILLHHPFSLRTPHGARQEPPGTEAHRVTVLMAKGGQ